jgi:hypothetical protein
MEKNNLVNHYKILGIDNFSSVEKVTKAYDVILLNYNSIQNPTPLQQKQQFDAEQAFNTLYNSYTKEQYDNLLSSVLSAEKTKTRLNESKKSTNTNSNSKYIKVVVAAAMVASIFYFYQSKSNNFENNEQQQIVKPLDKPQDTSNEDQKTESPFLKTFVDESQRQRSASLYFGLLGDKNIQLTTQYPKEAFLSPITLSPLGEPLPTSSSLLQGFSSYSYGEANLRLNNPTSEAAIVKIIFLDEDENFAIRHALILGGEQLVFAGLPEGAIQVAVLFLNHPQVAFLTHQYRLFNDMENEMSLYGQKFTADALF